MPPILGHGSRDIPEDVFLKTFEHGRTEDYVRVSDRNLIVLGSIIYTSKSYLRCWGSLISAGLVARVKSSFGDDLHDL
ncbi:MAG: hypothetical protein ACOC5C_05855 [Halobacteriota archaeon]